MKKELQAIKKAEKMAEKDRKRLEKELASKEKADVKTGGRRRPGTACKDGCDV